MALRTIKKPEWVTYLTSIGIPQEHAESYAAKFAEQQIQKKFLKFISDDELQDVFGVKLVGHRMAIRHSEDEPLPPPSTTHIPPLGARSHVKYDPPQLKPKMTPSSFRAFTTHWEVYKQLAGIPSNNHDSTAQILLLTCTSHPEIRQTIADHRADHLQLGEKEYIDMLKRILTSRANQETYRKKLFGMTQHPSETCQQWVQRLQEIAPDCEFTIPCSEKPGLFHKYDESILRTKFIQGVYSTRIKHELFAKSSSLPTLDSVVNHAIEMEESFGNLEQGPNTVGGVEDEGTDSSDEEIGRISNYKKLQRPKISQSQKGKPCDGCGFTHHTSDERQSKCPAWKKLKRK
ncbi:MAG: hypothetical protein AAFO91_12390, partial [Bacteroidota bacterium]